MKTVKELYVRLTTEVNFKDKYPQYAPDDKKIHVLFLSACTNESGYYRMLLPSLELNRTDTHAAIVGHIHKWDFNKMFDDYDTPIDFRLVKWADYVVIPTLFTDVNYIIKNMREINSDIEFLMDVDVNYHELPAYHPDAKKLLPELKKVLIKNLLQVDIFTAPNNAIVNFYYDLVEQMKEDEELYYERYGNLLSNFTYEERRQIIRNQGEKVRIGVILDASQGNDLKTIEKPIAELLAKHKDKVEIIIFGWSKKVAEQYNVLNDLRITYEKPVPFQDYHYWLNSLAFDIGLLPFANNNFNQSGKTILRYLDFAANMTPVVAPKMQPYEKIIQEGENGFMAASEEEWVSKTEQLISNVQLRRDMGNYTHKFVWENFSYTPKAIQRLRSIFI